MKLEVLGHASVKLIGDKIIYFDPYKIEDKYNDADYIFITHDHYDHYDIESIMNVKNDKTKIIGPKCLENKGCDLIVEPNKTYEIDDISFMTIPAYNLDKDFHKVTDLFVGYNILLDGLYYYIMGDTDRTKEAENVKTDVCFVPIGGTYTMDVSEAAEYINIIKPKTVIPIHYGMLVGDKSLGEEFKNKIDKDIQVKVLI